ncbi:PREDICTED: uncharacterized protein LOC106538149 [Thamnophis sirtalis]|uniref:ribonuclease H n=1 Tax=Thamnophis sirtalis TaxID=35019 RepID=A0A6I9WYM0_9SAUR|nr:PREDICTED: uncharacterized protein LOC106538149 [Thamnophis sirtalis]
MASIDLMEAYLHIPIFPGHRKYLRFSYLGIHYQYRALPFGLASVPQTFTKVLAAVTTYLRECSVRVQGYLNDILVQAASFERVREDLSLVVSTLQQLGFSVNLDKSSLIPATRIPHLGTIIDSKLEKVLLSHDHKVSLLALVRQVRSQHFVPVVVLSILLGKFISRINVVPWACLYVRLPQWRLLPHQRSNSPLKERTQIHYGHNKLKLQNSRGK